CQPRKLWQGGRSPPASPAAAALLYQRNASVASRGKTHAKAVTRKTRPVSWIRAALRDFETVPAGAQSICLSSVDHRRRGRQGRCCEAAQGAWIGHVRDRIAIPGRCVPGDLWRADCRGDLGSPRVSEEIRARRRDSSARNRRSQAAPEALEGGVTMKREKLDLVSGSGNVFRDLCIENADVLQLKAILAGEIIKTLDGEGLTVRAAQVRTGMAAADFSRIRKADLGRFTVDRLMTVISRLGSRVDVTVKVRRPRAAA